MTEPAPGSRWLHKRDKRVIIVDLVYDRSGPTRTIDYRYVRTVGGMGRDRSTPVQSMSYDMWKTIFIPE